MKQTRPRVFIGSSAEGMPIAEAVQVALDHDAEATLWSQGVFGLSGGTLDDLVRASQAFEFAILVLTPDDLIRKRESVGNGPRDNVLFELGLFMGALGRDRTFVLYSRDDKPELPSDLAGVTAATYAKRIDGNTQAAVGPACTEIKRAISKALALPTKLAESPPIRLKSIMRPYEPKLHRGRARIAVIDDEPFSPAPFLRASGFSIEELGDVADVEPLNEYLVVICDIKGVGAAFGDLGGAYLLRTIREKHPDIYLMAFTAHPHIPRILPLLRYADKTIRKDYHDEDWVTELDSVISSMVDPVTRWKALRRTLLDEDHDLETIVVAEQAFVRAIEQKSQIPAGPGLPPNLGVDIVRRLNESVLRLTRLNEE